ncbi:MAG: hypothetical protein EPO51_21215 [Phenylobacterium sp.]|uniref:hypothetical protein n=1 Tax=Phenylobacterium sp. TaxID=1871053 RepID=UPI001221AF4B|nr:hypothetical protein [Phenylobacterium sp.]TAJ70040.1 MAG: hypothetical protein EPO51_21215 [Phenylobacterium sp.]
MVALLLAALFQSAAPASAVATPIAPPAKAARLCRSETVVGSTIKKRICRPKPVGEVAQGDKTDTAQLAQAAPK